MAIQKTIGGDRVGSGKKMKAYLHNYNRSTHNLSEKWATSANCGILYPCFVKPAMRGDAFDIKINADARTIPTVGPLFGNFKFQIDFYQCPIRLYQSILHNNPQAIGLKMNQVKLPQLLISSAGKKSTKNINVFKFNESSLMKYLGVSGIGVPTLGSEAWAAHRKFNAVPALAYYDIFKTYYANKQEENAYVITPNTHAKIENITEALLQYGISDERIDILNETWDFTDLDQNKAVLFYINTSKNLSKTETDQIRITLEGTSNTIKDWNEYYRENLNPYVDAFVYNDASKPNKGEYIYYTSILRLKQLADAFHEGQIISIEPDITIGGFETQLNLTPFPLKNIDDMRYDILSEHTMGAAFLIGAVEHNYLPYSTLTSTHEELDGETYINVTNNTYPLNGLVVKTYQNDIFNNWLNAEWIEGENGVNELSKVQVIDGKFSMDALSFAQKQYDMLNRIAVAGNTYEDWQDVVYEEVKRRQIESPMFIGGMSQYIYFDEIVQTAPADGDPLGTLGGRGSMKQQTKKGGTVHVKCDEACFIIGIASLTPIIYQTQGNEFYMTELQSLDDFHKPAMDGIGFQDLLGERMAWFDTQIDNVTGTLHRSKIGKLPAWIEYMTSVDKAYGDFAQTEGRGYMILNRNYEFDDENYGIKDVTTYIDPAKYNYVFANANLDAQNFWLEVHFDVKARRLMSARIMPSV